MTARRDGCGERTIHQTHSGANLDARKKRLSCKLGWFKGQSVGESTFLSCLMDGDWSPSRFDTSRFWLRFYCVSTFSYTVTCQKLFIECGDLIGKCISFRDFINTIEMLKRWYSSRDGPFDLCVLYWSVIFMYMYCMSIKFPKSI